VDLDLQGPTSCSIPPRRRRVLQKRPFIIASRAEWENIVRDLGLSRQQVRITKLLLRGLRDKQIAGLLRVSVNTVRTHLSRIFKRTGCADRVELLLAIFASLRASDRACVCHRKR